MWNRASFGSEGGMSAKHTPGPWQAESRFPKGDLQRPWVGRLAEQRYSALACGETVEEAIANARLIAAAPDMLEALEETRTALQHAANTFYRYAKLHRAKGTDQGDEKACANAGMGEEMNAAIAVIDACLSRARGEHPGGEG